MADGIPPQSPPGNFKPNIYPVMYWALAYGVAAGILMFLLTLLSQFITNIWFPVFLVGLIWGGYRNYQRQKRAWEATSGTTSGPGSPVSEFRQAVSDIADASRELINQQSVEDATAQPEQSTTDAAAPAEDSQYPPQNQPPTPPTPPAT